MVQHTLAPPPLVVLCRNHRRRYHRHLHSREQVMARKVFFSFKYEDVSRAMVVRNSWVTQGREASGFIDAAAYEEVKKKGDGAIKAWIDGQLDGTTVTV